MKLEEFVKQMKANMDTFQTNLSESHENSEKSMATWMQWFLDWSEWKTEMHEEYWGYEEEYSK